MLIHISRSAPLTSIKVLPLGWGVERRRSGEHQKARPPGLRRKSLKWGGVCCIIYNK